MTDKSKNESGTPDFLLLLILFALVAIGGLIAIVIHDMGAAQRRMEYNHKMDQMEAETKATIDRMNREDMENRARQFEASRRASAEQYWRARANSERYYRERGY